jgi:tetratricopeptide (TPR) repeat protein
MLELKIVSKEGTVLLDHQFHPDGSHPEASYASDSIPRKFAPLETLQVEEAYQLGLGHEKFGQISDAERAYKAALAKDPLFSPAHLRLGLLALDRFQWNEAAQHFEMVLERDPTNGDAHYFLGIVDTELGQHLDARRHYYRILLSSDKFRRRDYALGLLNLSEGSHSEALQELAAAAALTPEDVSVREAYAYLLRKEGHLPEAQNETKAILELDPTNAFAPAERWFQPGASESERSEDLDLLDRACAHHPQGYLELASEYFRLSAWQEAAQVLAHGVEITTRDGQPPYPLLLYYGAYAAEQLGNKQAARQLVEQARQEDQRLEIFPFRAEDVKVLKMAADTEPKDANARALLGDLLYSRDRRGDATELWRAAVQADPRNFSALRNLGMATLVEGKQEEGLGLLTRAAQVRPDHLATTLLVANVNARLGHTQEARDAFKKALQLQPKSDQVVQKLASLEAQMGNYSRALEVIDAHKFQATHLSYSLLHLYRGIRLMLALQAARNSQFSEALLHVRSATRPPSSLGVDDFATVRSSRLLVYEALLHQAAGDSAAANAAWQAAAKTLDDAIEGEGLFRAIGLYKAGEVQKAEDWFKEFATVNELRKTDNAVNLRLQAYDLAGVYAAMRGDDALARQNFKKALEIDQSYLYARQSLAWLDARMLEGLRP